MAFSDPPQSIRSILAEALAKIKAEHGIEIRKMTVRDVDCSPPTFGGVAWAPGCRPTAVTKREITIEGFAE